MFPERFNRLVVWNGRDHSAPHKPLVVLYALAKPTAAHLSKESQAIADELRAVGIPEPFTFGPGRFGWYFGLW